MKGKKNIDKLFEERFTDFEASPSPRVWEKIQAELKKEKEERKVIPLWIKLGGIAALLALLLTVGNGVFNSSDIGVPSVTNENIQKPENILHEENPSSVQKELEKPQVAEEENTLQNEGTREDDASNNSSIRNKEAVHSSNKKENSFVIASENANKTSSEKEKISKEKLFKKNGSETSDERERLTSNNSSKQIQKDNDTKLSNEDFIKKDKDISEIKKEGVVIAENSKNKTLETAFEKKEEELKTGDDSNKKSILDAIAEQNEAKEINIKPTVLNRWELAPTVAPVYYSSLGNGSSIDPSFSDNSQSGDVNVSYGVQVSYAVNNRLKIRAGVNNVDLSYSTSGIEVGTGPVAFALRSVDYGGKDIVITAVDKGTLMEGAQSNGFGDVKPKSTQGNAKIIQSINYYEIPLELKYAVINNRFGVNLIGGLSTLFLGNSEISVKADNFNSVLGEANNLSTVSFSTNVGLGLDYKLSKKFTFNIEPMFKYQLNPYTDSSVDFRPYYLGVYSGLSFKF